MAGENSIVGDLINFRGLVYAPLNENGVIFLFGKVLDDLHMYVEEIRPGFPDCVARRFTGKGWERLRIEFELNSSAFKTHGHDSDACDMIICWEHDWKDCPLEVIELRSEIQDLENWPIRRPDVGGRPVADSEQALQELFRSRGVTESVQEWYGEIIDALRSWNEEIWTNIGKKYIGVYSPERSFASIQPRKTSIRVECFSRGERLEGTKVSSTRFSPRWAKFTVKAKRDVHAAIEILKESHTRLKAAMKAGEPTAYFSGGEKPGSSFEGSISTD